MKDIEDINGITRLNVISEGEVVGYARSRAFIKFFEDQVSNEGLLDFHITIKPNLTNEQIANVLQETIDTWDSEAKPIYHVTFP